MLDEDKLRDIECAICGNKPVSLNQVKALWRVSVDIETGDPIYFCGLPHQKDYEDVQKQTSQLR